MAGEPERTAAAERLAALGRLASGVAHDFNNILTVVAGYAEILAQSIGDDADARDAVEMILDAARRGGVVTTQLLQFSRRQDADAGELDVAAVVRDCAAEWKSLSPSRVAVTVAVTDAPAVARIDRDALTQALARLVSFAGKSIKDRGTIVLTARSTARIGFVDAYGDEAPSGHYVEIGVADTGEGLDDYARLHIFEPFFSATGQGKGAGLGLAAAVGIAKANGGFVEVASAPGRGTTFTLSLPMVDASIALADDLSDRRTAVGTTR